MTRPHLAIATAAIALILSGGCAVAPSPSSSTIATAATSSPSARVTSSASANPIPPLLLFAHSGPQQGLWRLDLIGQAPQPFVATTQMGAPPGLWRATAPAMGGLTALTSVGKTPVQVALARVESTTFEPLWLTTLPNDDRWAGGHAECVSSDGIVAVGDDGLVLYTLDTRRQLALVPGQRNNLGECTWLDARTVLWDQEESQMRSWTLGASDSAPVMVKRLDPTAGGGRLAWFDDGAGTIRVATFEVSGSEVLIGPEFGGITLGPDDYPGGLGLSPDGQWLMGLLGDGLAIFRVSNAGLGERRREDVNARLPAFEEVARAVPRITVEGHVVRVVVPAKREGQLLDGDPIEFARIAIRFLDLPDQAGVHRSILLPGWRPSRAMCDSVPSDEDTALRVEGTAATVRGHPPKGAPPRRSLKPRPCAP